MRCLTLGMLMLPATVLYASRASAQTRDVNADDLRSIAQVLASQPDQSDDDRLSYVFSRCAALYTYVGTKLEEQSADTSSAGQAKQVAGELFFEMAKVIDQEAQAKRGKPWTEARASRSVTSRVMTMVEYYMARAQRSFALTGNAWAGDAVFESDFATCDAVLDDLGSEGDDDV